MTAQIGLPPYLTFGDRCWQITAPHFVAGLTEAPDGSITSAAPIIRYFYNANMSWVRRYCASMGWQLMEVKP